MEGVDRGTRLTHTHGGCSCTPARSCPVVALKPDRGAACQGITLREQRGREGTEVDKGSAHENGPNFTSMRQEQTFLSETESCTHAVNPHLVFAVFCILMCPVVSLLVTSLVCSVPLDSTPEGQSPKCQGQAPRMASALTVFAE